MHAAADQTRQVTRRGVHRTVGLTDQRAEGADPKDCPQDAQNLVEWYYRLENMREWRVNSYPDGFSPDELRDLRRTTRIDYLIAWTNPEADPVRLRPVYRNASFSIYQLGDLD